MSPIECTPTALVGISNRVVGKFLQHTTIFPSNVGFSNIVVRFTSQLGVDGGLRHLVVDNARQMNLFNNLF